MVDLIDTPAKGKSTKKRSATSKKENNSNNTESEIKKPQLKEDAPIAVILFAGGGGIESGMIEAGIRPVTAVELDSEREELSNKTADCHDNNFKEYGCVTLRKTVQECADNFFSGFPKDIDYLHASPSCKNFSNAKQKKGEQIEDTSAAEAIGTAIARLKPKIFTLEQVPGYKDTNAFQMICARLRTCGYVVQWEVINFADYGVPQSRQRLILRAGKDFMLPMPIMRDRVGWYDAIADLIPGMEDSELLDGQKEAIKEYFDGEINQPLLIGRTGRSADRIRARNQGCFTLTTAIFTDQREGNRTKFADIALPDGTVKSLSIEAAARLQGFPEWYKFSGECGVDGVILGNSVPPSLASQLFSQELVAVPKSAAIICCGVEELGSHQELCDRLSLDINFISPDEHQTKTLREKKEAIQEILHKYPSDSQIVVISDREFWEEFNHYEGIYKFQFLVAGEQEDEEIGSGGDRGNKDGEIGSGGDRGNEQFSNTSSPLRPSANEKINTDIFVEDGKTYIKISAINMDIATQSRVAINADVVEEYKQAIGEGVEFPPILIFHSEEGNFLVDGWHRSLAFKSICSDGWIHATIQSGTRREALLHSCGVNSAHGLRRTSADKRKAVTTLLKDEEWSQWSNREIARRCGCDEGTVRKIRAELSAENPQMEREEIKFQRGGKEFSQKISKYKPKLMDEVRVISTGQTGEIRGIQGNNALVWLHGSHLNSREQIAIADIEPIAKENKTPTTIKQELNQQAKELGLKNKPQLLPDIPRNEGEPIPEPLPATYTGLNPVDIAIAVSQMDETQKAEILGILQIGDLVGFHKPKSKIEKDFSGQKGIVKRIEYVIEINGVEIQLSAESIYKIEAHQDIAA